MNILLLEDDRSTASSLIASFEMRGAAVVHALTVAEAQLQYEPDRFDVLLCDYELPDGTGLDFLTGIRGSDKAKTILWSGLDRTREVAAAGLELDYVLTKDDFDGMFKAVGFG